MKNVELDRYVLEYKNGNPEAFDVIYEETKKTVYLSIYTIYKDKQTIEDLMQDSYLKAIRSLDQYQIGTNFKAWIARIAKTLTINYYNRKKKEDILDPIDNDMVFNAPIKENRTLLDETLNILDNEEKDIITYKIVLDLKFREIANILNMTTSAVFYIYRKAIQKIKSNL